MGQCLEGSVALCVVWCRRWSHSVMIAFTVSTMYTYKACSKWHVFVCECLLSCHGTLLVAWWPGLSHLILLCMQELEDALLLDMNPDPSSLLVQLFVVFLNGIVDRDIT